LLSRFVDSLCELSGYLNSGENNKLTKGDKSSNDDKYEVRVDLVSGAHSDFGESDNPEPDVETFGKVWEKGQFTL